MKSFYNQYSNKKCKIEKELLRKIKHSNQKKQRRAIISVGNDMKKFNYKKRYFQSLVNDVTNIKQSIKKPVMDLTPIIYYDINKKESSSVPTNPIKDDLDSKHNSQRIIQKNEMLVNTSLHSSPKGSQKFIGKSQKNNSKQEVSKSSFSGSLIKKCSFTPKKAHKRFYKKIVEEYYLGLPKDYIFLKQK